jgi:hypothetical protein
MNHQPIWCAYCIQQKTQKKSPERSSNLSGEAVTQSVEKLEIRLGGKRTVDSPFIFMHPASDAFDQCRGGFFARHICFKQGAQGFHMGSFWLSGAWFFRKNLVFKEGRIDRAVVLEFVADR